MTTSFPQDLRSQVLQEQQHFQAAPQAFFEAWKQGAELAGSFWFGDGTDEGLENSSDKRELRPNVRLIGKALGYMSHDKRMFLAAMVSFYDSTHGSILLKRSCFEGLANFGCLDLAQRRVIADLTLNYMGW